MADSVVKNADEVVSVESEQGVDNVTETVDTDVSEMMDDDAGLSSDSSSDGSLSDESVNSGVDNTANKGSSSKWWQNVISYICNFLAQIVGENSEIGKLLKEYGNSVLGMGSGTSHLISAYKGPRSDVYNNPDFAENYSEMSKTMMNQMHNLGAYHVQQKAMDLAGQSEAYQNKLYSDGEKFAHNNCAYFESYVVDSADANADHRLNDEQLSVAQDSYMSMLRGAEAYRESAYAEIDIEYADDPTGAKNARLGVDLYTRGCVVETLTSAGSLNEYGFEFTEENMDEIASFNCYDLVDSDIYERAQDAVATNGYSASYAYYDHSEDAFSNLGSTWAENGVFETFDRMEPSAQASYFGKVSGNIGVTLEKEGADEFLELGKSYEIMYHAASAKLDEMASSGVNVDASRSGLNTFVNNSVYQMYDLCYSRGFSPVLMKEMDSLDFGSDVISYDDYYANRYSLETGKEFNNGDYQSAWYQQMADTENRASTYVANNDVDLDYQFDGSSVADVVAAYSMPESGLSNEDVSLTESVKLVEDASEKVVDGAGSSDRYAKAMEIFGHLFKNMSSPEREAGPEYGG